MLIVQRTCNFYKNKFELIDLAIGIFTFITYTHQHSWCERGKSYGLTAFCFRFLFCSITRIRAKIQFTASNIWLRGNNLKNYILLSRSLHSTGAALPRKSRRKKCQLCLLNAMHAVCNKLNLPGNRTTTIICISITFTLNLRKCLKTSNWVFQIVPHSWTYFVFYQVY